MQRLLVGCAASALFAATIGLGAGAVLAQEGTGAMWGSGETRICNVVVDKTGAPVMMNTEEGPVVQNQTFDCPEQIAAIEPAAALPEAGVVFFDFDKSNLRPDQQAVLDDIIFDIKDRELGGIISAGHTDTVGSFEYNMGLSQQRADTVAAELVKAGIPAQIITTEALGFTDPAVPTPPNTPLEANRRVVIDFTP
jgi:outer membrane protein OmpA-like peptidoglycan-associated protein